MLIILKQLSAFSPIVIQQISGALYFMTPESRHMRRLPYSRSLSLSLYQSTDRTTVSQSGVLFEDDKWSENM